MSGEVQQTEPTLHEMMSVMQETKTMLSETQDMVRCQVRSFDDFIKESFALGKGKCLGKKGAIVAMEQFKRHLFCFFSFK